MNKLKLVKFHADDWARGALPKHEDDGRPLEREYQDNVDGHCCLGHDQRACGMPDSSKWNDMWTGRPSAALEKKLGSQSNALLKYCAININDDTKLTDQQRYTLLKEVFREAGRELVIEGLDNGV